MDVVRLIDKVIANIPDAPNKNRIIAVINDSINKINLLIEPFDAIITVAQASDDTWDSITTTWENITTNWEDLGRFSDWFTYNAAENRLTANNNRIQRIKKIYLNGIEQLPVEYEGILASIYTGNQVAIVSNKIYFATNINPSTSGEIKMKVGLSFPSIKGTETSYAIPDFFEDLIYNEIVYILSNDNDQKALAKSLYNEGIELAGIKTNIYGVRE